MAQFSFQGINIEEVVQKSFTDYLNDKQIKFPNLNNSLLEKWDFEEYLNKNNILPMDLEKETDLIDLIPNISNANLQSLKLVKFFGTIQNTFENQLFISAKYDTKNKQYLINKYFENSTNVMKLEDDNMDNQGTVDILSDRLRLELIPVVGLNEYFGGKII